MEAAVATSTRMPLPLLPTAGRPLLPSGLARPRRGLASISVNSTFGAGGGGGGGGRMSGGGGGEGGGDDSGAGAAAAAAAVVALGDAQQQEDGDSDAIVLHVGGMSCGGCAAKVKRILESQRGFPSCDFEEYNYGPKSHWPSEYEFAEFEAGIKPWPCTMLPERKCKCGIKAREGVVPSELGYGYYCGNAYGGATEFWAGRTCNWEDFPGRGDLLERLKIHSPLEKSRKLWHRQEIQVEIRKKYNVPTPSWKTRQRIFEDFPRVTGRSLSQYFDEMELINFWRQHKETYDFKEAEDAREEAFFRRREQEKWTDELGNPSLRRRLFAEEVPNDGHLPAPMEDDSDDADDDIVDDNDDEELDSPEPFIWNSPDDAY